MDSLLDDALASSIAYLETRDLSSIVGQHVFSEAL